MLAQGIRAVKKFFQEGCRMASTQNGSAEIQMLRKYGAMAQGRITAFLLIFVTSLQMLYKSNDLS